MTLALLKNYILIKAVVKYVRHLKINTG